MRQFGKITLGGIQQKIFNLVLIMMILVMAAYSVVIFHQMNAISSVKEGGISAPLMKLFDLSVADHLAVLVVARREDAARSQIRHLSGDGKISANWRNFFSLASSAIRRQALLDYPFDEGIQYSEDIEWTWRSRQRGERIVYCPEAFVKHSHNYTIRQLWVRFFNEGRADGRIYGEIPPLLACFRRFAMECARDAIYLLKHGAFNELLMSPIRRYIQVFAHRKGCKEYLETTEGA